MLNTLKDLANVVDVVVVVGAPNIRYFLGVDVEDNAVIIYRGSTSECKVVVPVNTRKHVEQVASRVCTVIAYSYDVYPDHGYVLGRDFYTIVLSTLKTVAMRDEGIGVPIAYADALLYSALSRFWKITDISRNIRITRAKKKHDELNMFIDVHNMIKRTTDNQHKKGQQVVEEYLKRLSTNFDGIYIEPLISTENYYSLRLGIKRGIYRFSYRLTIPLSEDSKNLISNMSNGLENVLKDRYINPCASLVKSIKTQMRYGTTKVSHVEICGIGTEHCEYPTTSECLYEDTYLTDGMAVKIEVAIDGTVFIPKLVVIRNGKAEVY